MKLLAFKIKNFRSIVNTGWVSFSMDGVTVFVGQNESGKTSVLDALARTFSGLQIADDDLRYGAPLPEFYLIVQVDSAELRDFAEGFEDVSRGILLNHSKEQDGKFEIRFFWEKKSGKYSGNFEILAPLLVTALEAIEEQTGAGKPGSSEAPSSQPHADAVATSQQSPTVQSLEAGLPQLTHEHLRDFIWEIAPSMTMFHEESGILPGRIDVPDDFKLVGQGAPAAINYLAVANLDLATLVKADPRMRENMLKRANKRLSEDFQSFWSQTIGKTNRVTLECSVESHGNAAGEMAGKPSLLFWLSDGNNQLYPNQRSKGVTWFVSFYLQLRAVELKGVRHFFLLDEPGSNLHSKAQADVLKLIEKMRVSTPLAYSTHSPHLVEYDRLYRVLAVQREGEGEGNPTVIIHSHALGAASRDTLSPVLTAMGVDLSHQQVIKKERNVLLEEISAFYYLKSIWRLTGSNVKASFIAATGVNNVPVFAQMFVGWGLDFIVLVDDDKSGRDVYNTLLRDLYKNDATAAKFKLQKMPFATCIEDAFSIPDFKKYVLLDASLSYTEANSSYVKSAGRTKALDALTFALAVEGGSPTLEDFDSATKVNMHLLLENIKQGLDAKNLKVSE